MPLAKGTRIAAGVIVLLTTPVQYKERGVSTTALQRPI
jgi:hypothetical protein